VPTFPSPEWNWNGISQVPGIPFTYEVTALPQLLKNSGYHTIHCGKAHWGAIDTPGENPHHFGFEVNIAGHAGGRGLPVTTVRTITGTEPMVAHRHRKRFLDWRGIGAVTLSSQRR